MGIYKVIRIPMPKLPKWQVVQKKKKRKPVSSFGTRKKIAFLQKGQPIRKKRITPKQTLVLLFLVVVLAKTISSMGRTEETETAEQQQEISQNWFLQEGLPY